MAAGILSRGHRVLVVALGGQIYSSEKHRE